MVEMNTLYDGNSKQTSSASNKALVGVRVVELSQLVAGPYCAKLLADLGAEVIKIEKPGYGDEARHRGPFAGDTIHPEKSLLFLYLNTNKMGVTLDVEMDRDYKKFIELVKWADILIIDEPPHMLERLKLTYEDVHSINPRLVMTSITPFGQTGPYRDYKAYPLNTYHSGGLGYLSPRVEPGTTGPPLKPGGFFSEYGCGLVSAVGTLAALYEQHRTAQGQLVDISKQEAILSLCRVQVIRYPNEGFIQSRYDGARAYGDVFQCKDGYVIQMVNQPSEWQSLANLIANPEWGNDVRYQNVDFRQKHWDEISPHISRWLMNHTMDDTYHQGQAIKWPIAPVMTAKDIVNSAQYKARQFFVEATHPITESQQYPSTPYHFSITPTTIERTAPLLGQHTKEVFSTLLNPNKSTQKTIETITQIFGDGKHKIRGPLRGIRIADFSWAWAGAHATELLAFLGAEVIRVESSQHIDFARLRSFTTSQQFGSLNESPVFNDINLGKLSITINLSQPKGIDLAKKLISISDVTIQNMRPGVMERLGLGYEAVKKVKPDIIYLSSSALGATGPEREYSGYAPTFAALGGISHITGILNGTPSYMTGEIDLLSAVTSTFAILAALNYHYKTGEGQHIDVSSAESISVLIGEVLMDYTANGRTQKPKGNLDEFMAPHNCYRCKGENKWISIAVATDEEWKILCKVMRNPDWAKDQRFATAHGRQQNIDELDKLIEVWTSNYAHYELMEMLQKAGIAAMPCFNSKELFRDIHLNNRNCWTKVNHPVLGEQAALSPPWKLSSTPAVIAAPAPLFGQHSNYVFSELLGLTNDEIHLLEEEQVIY